MVQAKRLCFETGDAGVTRNPPCKSPARPQRRLIEFARAWLGRLLVLSASKSQHNMQN